MGVGITDIVEGEGLGASEVADLLTHTVVPSSSRTRNQFPFTSRIFREVRTKFSIVFQEGALFDSLNVKENVAFGLREYTKMTEEEIDRKVRELLGKVGLEHAMELMPEELSGGMHRRVAIMRSLAAFDPRMFLYDEATTGLDPVNADIICRLILDLAKGEKGFIIVTHKVFDALRLAERFMFLKNGLIMLDGNKEQLMQSSLPEIHVFLTELSPPLPASS